MAAICFIAISQRSSASTIQWQRSFGGTNDDFAAVVKPTSDGGSIVGGYSVSAPSGTKAAASYGLGDFWVVKLDAAGAKQSDWSFGGSNFDGIKALQQTSDGGYVFAGLSYSDVSGNKTSSSYGAGDFWIVKVSAAGVKQWEKAFGGTNVDIARCIEQTSDGGYIVGGISFSGVSGNKITSAMGTNSADYWIVRLDAAGNRLWERTFGGNEVDELHALQQTADGGFILGGHSFSAPSGNKSAALLGTGTSDFWIVKVDASGNKQWDRTYGGDDAEELRSLQRTTDGGFIIAGRSYSDVSGNKSSPNLGSHDFWVVKLDGNGNRQWDRTFGGTEEDSLDVILNTIDGAYVVAGISHSGISGNKRNRSAADCDYWMVRLDGSGNKQWEQTIPSAYMDEPSRLQAARDGGYIVAGLSNSVLSGQLDFGVTRLNSAVHITTFSISNRVLRAELTAVPGSNYVLQASTTATAWSPLATVRATNGFVTFAHTNPVGIAQTLYRVQQLP